MARLTKREQPALAVIGLGAMGSRIATRLLERGHRVAVWNRTAAKAQALAHIGAEVAESPAAAVDGVSIAITMLADPGALASVSEGHAGLATALRSDQILIEMSTVGGAAVARLRDTLDEKVALVDAPVLGSIHEAAAGKLVIFVGGTEADVRRVRPILAELGTPLHVGGLGAGAAAKLVANSTLFGVLGVLGEALALADRLGLDRATTYEILAQTPLAAQTERRRESLATGSYPPRFALSLARKDASLIVQAGASAGADLRLAPAALAWLDDAERSGAGAYDYSAVLETIGGAGLEQSALTRIRAAATAAGPREVRAATIAAHIREGRGYRWVGIYDVTATEVAILAWSGNGPPAHPRFPRSHGLTGRAVASAETVVVQDVTSDTDYLEAFGDTCAEVIVPVIVAGAVVGTIDIESSEPSAFTEDDRAFLERCRDQALPVWG